MTNLLHDYKLNNNGLLVRDNSPTEAHLNLVPEFLPFIGVCTKADLFKAPNDPRSVLDFLSGNLNNGLSLDFSNEEKALWNKVMTVMNKVERFKGDADLKGLGGNVCEHSLFSCLLAYSFFSDIMKNSYFSPFEQKKLREIFSDVARSILVHDVGEWLGEFGTLAQENAGKTSKDCAYERNFTEYLFELAFLSDDFEGLTSKLQARGIAAIDEANALPNKSQRDEFLLEKFSQLDSEISALCTKLRVEQGIEDLNDFTKFRLHDFDRAENYSDFVGTFARITEKLEGSLHLLVLINKGHDVKIIGGNHVTLSLAGTASYNESAMHKLFSYAHDACAPDRDGESEIPRQIGFGLADLIRREIYNYMAGYSLATISTKNGSLQRQIHDPVTMAMVYLSAAQTGYEPTQENPVIAKMTNLATLKPSAAAKQDFMAEARNLGIELDNGLSRTG